MKQFIIESKETEVRIKIRKYSDGSIKILKSYLDSKYGKSDIYIDPILTKRFLDVIKQENGK